MKTKLLKDTELDLAANFLKNGQIVAFPTETVFGLGIIFDNLEAFNKLVTIKQRPVTQPFTLMCAHVKDIQNFAHINSDAQKIIDEFLPGQLTIILKVKGDVPTHVTLGSDYIGIRVSDDLMVANLISLVAKPLLVPSANKHANKPALTSEEVTATFGGEIAAIIKGKATSHIPSTIVKVSDKIELIREGFIPFENILNIIKEKK